MGIYLSIHLYYTRVHTHAYIPIHTRAYIIYRAHLLPLGRSLPSFLREREQIRRHPGGRRRGVVAEQARTRRRGESEMRAGRSAAVYWRGEPSPAIPGFLLSFSLPHSLSSSARAPASHPHQALSLARARPLPPQRFPGETRAHAERGEG